MKEIKVTTIQDLLKLLSCKKYLLLPTGEKVTIDIEASKFK